MLIDKLNKKLDSFQDEKKNLNDGKIILFSMGESIKQLITDAVNNANETNSVDERIKSLIDGLQTVMFEVNDRQKKYLSDMELLEVKIATLEEVLLEHLESTDESEELVAPQ
tara:strand:- start:296 stop:631 length:336 start_codon:yes stop_codon:yes gene_type:complete